MKRCFLSVGVGCAIKIRYSIEVSCSSAICDISCESLTGDARHAAKESSGVMQFELHNGGKLLRAGVTLR